MSAQFGFLFFGCFVFKLKTVLPPLEVGVEMRGKHKMDG